MASPESRVQSCLNRMIELWQVDSNRMKWLESKDGFEWWPGDYRVLVQATTGRREDAEGFIKLTARTSFLRNVDATTEKFEQLVGTFSRYTTSTFSWVYPPKSISEKLGGQSKSTDLWLHGSVYLDEQNSGWLNDFFAHMTIIQPINAQIQGTRMADIVGSGIADKTRPENLASLPLDDVLEVVAEIYAPIGKQPSRFAGHDEFETFAENYARNDNCFGNGDKTGLTLETPFGSDSVLIRLRTEEPHPQLGNGLLATLQLPYSGDGLMMAQQAAELNFLETISWTGFPQLGSWHTAQNRGTEEGVAFTLFVPSALYKPYIATNIAFWLLARARWVRETLYPDLQDLTMMQILEERFGPLEVES